MPGGCVVAVRWLTNLKTIRRGTIIIKAVGVVFSVKTIRRGNYYNIGCSYRFWCGNDTERDN